MVYDETSIVKITITINKFNNKINLCGNHKKLKNLLNNYQL